MTQGTYTLLTIEAEKARIRKEMDALKGRMKERTEELFAAPPADTKMQRIMNSAERALAVWDGVWMGYKLIKAFGIFLPGKYKRRK